MKCNQIKFFLILIVSILACVTSLPYISESDENHSELQITSEGVVLRSPLVGGGNCVHPPENFQELDLVGEWVAGWNKLNDTLVLKTNGTYKQILNDLAADYFYESDWKRWWLEYSESGIPYLHLEGMHLCVYHLSYDCRVEGGGDQGWYDFCEERIVQMPNEGILSVLGIPKRFDQPLRGIELVPFTIDPDTSGWSYTLQE